jgi:hypothetical protein
VARVLAAQVSSELLKKVAGKVKGAPLLVLSILGMMDKAGEASKELQDRYPALYRYLEADGLHMAWFLVASLEKELRKPLESQLGPALR